MTSIANRIRQKIERGGPDRLWTMSDFTALPATAVAKNFSRLSREGVIGRLRKGVYYRPKSTRFGTTKASAGAVVAALLDNRNVEWKPSGLAVWNALGLTTQLAAQPAFTVSRRTSITLSGSRVKLVVSPGTASLSAEEAAAIEALRDLHRVPDAEPADTLKRLLQLCKQGRLSFDKMCIAGRREAPRVRALLGLMGTLLGADHKGLADLKKSLNPLTAFKLDLGAHFPEARDWNIR